MLWPESRSNFDSLHSAAEDADRVLAEQCGEAPAAAATLKARDNLKPPEWHTWNSSDQGLIPVYAHDISMNYRDPLAPPPADHVKLFEDQLRKLNQTFKDSEAPFRFIYTGLYTKYRPSYDYGGKPCPTVDSAVETARMQMTHSNATHQGRTCIKTA
ncbi:hypothetical protein MVLG_02025 [Microbotryum lychnidis-dioicae p1A1 Lamole]|uniref:Uncharacterized protein n=1 Tax=Microbotryum lychnidis-dioicae (strain p1A1 Lamole / MvSl-1064) TaxID=683840 RepID=U5H3X2_USTV1|nr:hypothetical protein MVLG_02025 [Microbotryum lychnidis-dioicae p1A1 Lamole]|eukprot:KDE07755.1 hypothetical protein MVLG_02025 [Microbotryum lychnidis-dioicae p1A1 Lamole]